MRRQYSNQIEAALRPKDVIKNPAEAHFCAYAKKRGWTATKKGWPDFFCVLPDGKIAVVEVKRKATSKLRSQQVYILRSLAEAGIACYSYSPDRGLRPFKYANVGNYMPPGVTCNDVDWPPTTHAASRPSPTEWDELD